MEKDRNILPEERFLFRDIMPDETEQAAFIEQVCFPPNEACAPAIMKKRVETAPELFLVAIDRNTGDIAGFLNGLSTHESIFRDEFFTDVSLYEKDGDTVMLLGLDVMPPYRRQGLASELVRIYIAREREKGRRRLVLTCLDSKVDMYRKMGFHDCGLSGSVWGGEAWHEMDFLL